MKLLFVSLGCDKNLVDSEEMLGLLTGNGFAVKSWLSQDVWHSVIRMRSLRKYRK